MPRGELRRRPDRSRATGRKSETRNQKLERENRKSQNPHTQTRCMGHPATRSHEQREARRPATKSKRGRMRSMQETDYPHFLLKAVYDAVLFVGLVEQQRR